MGVAESCLIVSLFSVVPKTGRSRYRHLGLSR